MNINHRALWKSWELKESWVSPNGVWKIVATIKENPGFPNNKNMAIRDVKIYRYASASFEEYLDDGRTPKYVMKKYREFMNLIYERSEPT